MFKMIRCGRCFDLVIVVTPADAVPETPNAKFYRYATWEIGEHKPGVFNEVTRSTAIGYFSGHADGSGFEECPKDSFPTLEDALHYIEEKRIVLCPIREKELEAFRQTGQ